MYHYIVSSGKPQQLKREVQTDQSFCSDTKCISLVIYSSLRIESGGKMLSSIPSIVDVQDYWDERPCNIRHSKSPIGSVEYFNEVEARKYFVEPHILEFASFQEWQGKSVLEIGCGIGTDAVNFVRAGAFYTGVELSGASLEIAKQRFNQFKLEGSFIKGNAEELSSVLEEGAFDLIYSFGVLHHTPSIDNALREIRKYMNKESHFKFMVYAANSWKQSMINAGLDQPEAQNGCPIANSYTRSQIEEILNKAGFKIDSIAQDHIFPYEVDSYKEHIYKKTPWFAAMPPNVMNVLEINFGWHLLINASLI
jgi:ubiquinone/menaquinone biosynthesis C-methylase UbiE